MAGTRTVPTAQRLPHFLLAFVLFVTTQAVAKSPLPRGGRRQRRLVWSDEFDGTTLDPSKWKADPGCDGVINNGEKECYVDSARNIFLDGKGNLVLRGIRDNTTSQPFSSGRINTKGLAAWRYGRFVARLKVPSGFGWWPAFWMMPQNDTYGTWPRSGEIDIMEWVGRDPTTVHGTVHFGSPTVHRHISGQAKISPKDHKGGGFADAFHVYEADWNKDRIVWFVDGRRYSTVRRKTGDPKYANRYAPAPTWPFNQYFYIILNLAMGGRWPRAPDPAINSGDFIIDYIRVYQ